MIDCKELIVNLLKRIDVLKDEKVSAGTKYRLMGLVADIAEVAQGLQEKVLARVSQEVVLDADVDIDYAELSEEVLAKELPEGTEIPCEYNNIRMLATLSFMSEDPRQMDKVRYSTNDQKDFFQLKEVAVALRQELRKVKDVEMGV